MGRPEYVFNVGSYIIHPPYLLSTCWKFTFYSVLRFFFNRLTAVLDIPRDLKLR